MLQFILQLADTQVQRVGVGPVLQRQLRYVMVIPPQLVIVPNTGRTDLCPAVSRPGVAFFWRMYW